MSHIVCFGDSITRGENDRLGGGWADRLKVHFINQFAQTEKNETCVFNLGIGGETTEGLISRFNTELLPRLSGENDKVIFGYGANDLAYISRKQQIPVDVYTTNLSTCITIAKENNAAIFLVNILPISSAIEGVPNANGKVRHLSDIEEYNQQLAKLAITHGITLIDVHSPFTSEKESLLTSDGIHPNAAGHEFLFNIIRACLT